MDEEMNFEAEMAEAYARWACEYIGNDLDSYTVRLCAFAFAEGAAEGGRLIRRWMKKAIAETVAEHQP